MTAGFGVLTENGFGGLLSGGKAALFDVSGECSECCEDADPCPDCGGTDPKVATVAGVGATADCLDANDDYPFDTFIEGANICEWSWELNIGFLGAGRVILTYAKNSYGIFCPQLGGAVTFLPGEWQIRWTTARAVVEAYWKKTTGFACDPSTGRVSGTDNIDITAGDCGANPRCNGSVSITVDP